MKINILIVDDEYSGRNSLSILLKENCSPYIGIIKTSANILEATELISLHHFDICFLDIQLSNEIGFNLVDKIPEPTQIVYVTAYEKYALHAIKNKAFDYLLKPVNPTDLLEVIKRVYKINLFKQKKFLNVKEKGATIPIQQSDILLIKANGPYSEIQLFNGRIITTSQTLKSLTEKLNDDFIRVHKSYTIRKDAIASYNKNHIFFEPDKSIPLSRTGLKLLQELFSC